jgi:RNA polymerase sigma-70 factor (ECF subfamily)
MDDSRLSKIDTAWSVVHRAHDNESGIAQAAQKKLLDQYGHAIRRYLCGALRDAAVADDVYQDFAVRFIRGDFETASQERGRFRYFLKAVLFRMVTDHFRSHKRAANQLPHEHFEAADELAADDRSGVELNQVWRDEMLKRSWDALADAERRSGKPWFTVMKLRVENPQFQSRQLAHAISKAIGKSVSSTNGRVLLHRAREKFSHLLIDCISDSLQTSDMQEIEEELAELKLLDYCQSVLEQRKRA